MEVRQGNKDSEVNWEPELRCNPSVFRSINRILRKQEKGMKSQTTVFKNNHNEILMDCFMYPTLEVLSISYVSQLYSYVWGKGKDLLWYRWAKLAYYIHAICLPPPASLLLYRLTLRRDLKSTIIINALEQIHKDVFTRILSEALLIQKTSQNSLNVYEEEPG